MILSRDWPLLALAFLFGCVVAGLEQFIMLNGR